jgi:hypothetical protein
VWDSLIRLLNFSGGFQISQIITLIVIAAVLSYIGYLLKEVAVTFIQRQKLKNGPEKE